MKKVLFCNIPMKESNEKTVYSSDDASLPVNGKPSVYPISGFLERTLQSEDELKVLLLVKNDGHDYWRKNADICKAEISDACMSAGIPVHFEIVETAFSEERGVHNALLLQLLSAVEDGSHILADITYGPKDLPIVVFAALNFAERFLGCEIDHIIYGQAYFESGVPVHTKICDMIPLYSLNSLTNNLQCRTSDEARGMLKLLLDL